MDTIHTTSRRWFRFAFSLQTLFVLVAVGGLFVGWIANQRRQSAAERQIGADLQAQGVEVVFEGPYDSWDVAQSGQPSAWSQRCAR